MSSEGSESPGLRWRSCMNQAVYKGSHAIILNFTVKRTTKLNNEFYLAVTQYWY